jgi:hypothetical protein
MAKVVVEQTSGVKAVIECVDLIVLFPLQGSFDTYGKFSIRGKGNIGKIKTKLNRAAARCTRVFVFTLNNISSVNISGKVEIRQGA